MKNNLHKAKIEDKQIFAKNLTECFKDDPQLKWMLDKNEIGFEKRLHALFEYAFETTLIYGEIFLTEDKNGIAAWETPPKFQFNPRIILAGFKFLFQIGIKRTLKILKMEKIFKSLRPKENIYYLFLLGVLESERGKGYSSQLIDYYFEESKRTGFPIYLETSTEKNIEIYKKKGFVVFNEVDLDENTKVRSMKLE